MSKERRVVITGCGVASSLGIGADRFWEALLSGQNGIAPIEAYDGSGFDTTLGAEVPEFRINDYVPKHYRKSAKVMSRDIQLAVMCAYDAVKNAGLITRCLIDRGEAEGPVTQDSTRIGANIGAGLISADLPELAGALQVCGDRETARFDMTRWGEEGMNNLTPLWLLKFLPNMLGCHVTIVHDCQAPSNTITCGEASSHLAVGEAFRTIARGAADLCICGGAESKINPMAVLRQQIMKRLVTGSDDAPAQACRPFDPSANGMVAAESGGLLILEELEHARARRARIFAEVAGFGAATSIAGWSTPESDGAGIALAMQNALRDGRKSADALDLVVPFGSGINAFDASELEAIKTVLAKRENVSALALRGSLGNSGAGTGALDLAASAMAIYHNTIPPSPNTGSADTQGRLRFVQGDPADARINAALSTAYSISGGQIGSLLLTRYVA